MVTKIKTSKETMREINQLKSKVSRLQSAVIGFIAQDEEGEYRPEFVESVLKATREKPSHSFRDAKFFLADLEKHD